MAQVSWNYTTFLNIAFLVVAAVVVLRFVRTGGMPMLRMMHGRPDEMEATTTAPMATATVTIAAAA